MRPNKSVTVSGTATGGNGVASPPNATLTLADDDTLPTVALVLTPSTVGENGGVSTVTATLSGKSSAAVTVTVAAARGGVDGRGGGGLRPVGHDEADHRGRGHRRAPAR